MLAAFGEIYKSGFRGTDIDTIIEKAKVTKGALYHHFDGKEALGYAMVDAVLMPLTEEKWLRPLREARDPLKTLAAIVRDTQLTAEAVNGGCPVNNLAQEMSPLDEEFRSRIAECFARGTRALRKRCASGRNAGRCGAISTLSTRVWILWRRTRVTFRWRRMHRTRKYCEAGLGGWRRTSSRCEFAGRRINVQRCAGEGSQFPALKRDRDAGGTTD